MNRRHLAALIALSVAAPTAAAEISCHIHPPGSTPADPIGTIGPYDSAEACERARALRFGDAARCHCAADFTPRWVPPATAPGPGDSPLG